MKTIKDIPETKPCGRCKGTCRTDFEWNGQAHGPGPCSTCNATGVFSVPDWQAIIQAITKPGKNGRTFRLSKPPFKNEWKDRAEGRAYFVWRFVRFHSGQDVTMPVCAVSCVRNDPYFDELETLASLLAKRFFGTDIAAAMRWGNALGWDLPHLNGLPASAYSGGPVADEHKPESELPELVH